MIYGLLSISFVYLVIVISSFCLKFRFPRRQDTQVFLNKLQNKKSKLEKIFNNLPLLLLYVLSVVLFDIDHILRSWL